MAMTLKPNPNHPNGKGFAMTEEIKEKSKRELLANQKTVLRIEKNTGMSVLYLRGHNSY